MRQSLRIVPMLLLATLTLGGCAANGWKGADAEKAYDDQAAARRLADERNNDDYYEIHKDNRIVVLSDAGDYKVYVATNETPLVVTKIGAGPKGETLRFALTKKDAKAMEKIVGYKGAAQKMYEGDMAGADTNFYGEIHDAGKIYVFGDWASLAAYRKSGVANGSSQDGAGPEGETVVFVNAGPDAQSRFASLNPKK
jgi:hypothetical protein